MRLRERVAERGVKSGCKAVPGGWKSCWSTRSGSFTTVDAVDDRQKQLGWGMGRTVTLKRGGGGSPPSTACLGRGGYLGLWQTPAGPPIRPPTSENFSPREEWIL